MSIKRSKRIISGIHVLSSDEFTDIHIIIETSLTILLSTVECERIFSQAGLIKTDIRNSMSVETLDELLLIKMNGPRLEDYDFRNTIEDWKAGKQTFCLVFCYIEKHF